MAEDRKSCILCKHFKVEDGKVSCDKRLKVHEIPDFPFKDTNCEFYHYALNFSNLYCRRPKD